MTMAGVSVVICAYTEERWDDILAAVASVRAQQVRPHELILVVDHNERLRERLEAAVPDATVIANAHPRGLSGGKNTGIGAAGGELIAFLDDDAIAEPQWLTYLVEGHEDPRVVGVGGATYPRWDTGRPVWFPREFDWVVGCTYTGMPNGRGPVRNPSGGNSCFRTGALREIGGFRSGIGRTSTGRPLGCEETELSIRLRQRDPGAVLLYDPRAVIHHRVPAARSRWSYFRARCYAEGLSKAAVTEAVGMADGLASERHYTTRTLPLGIVHGLADGSRRRPGGLGRAAAITAGLAITTAGYTAGRAASAMRPVTSRRRGAEPSAGGTIP
jgi:GT2 family glycosyltransferase